MPYINLSPPLPNGVGDFLFIASMSGILYAALFVHYVGMSSRQKLTFVY